MIPHGRHLDPPGRQGRTAEGDPPWQLAELLLQMPQDDEPFERLPLEAREFPCA